MSTVDEMTRIVKQETYSNLGQAREAVKAVLKHLQDEVKANGEVAVIGFGTFKTVQLKERQGSNPKTGEKLVIPAKTVVRFKASKNF